ncbi:porin [Burkholderia sp. BCC0419]|uniref:porin n=1 Tax=Burkholderia sp. BCC0419 TaxID=486878 RepID=UPI001FC87CE3|nr:porin [Burkholderia sp. BCC0419]
MNKHLVLLISMLSMSVAARAQSSVTLYGVADDGITYTNNQKGASNVQMFSGGLGGSKFGLLGKEDLGGGMSAIFQLESGYDVNSGKLGYNQRLWGRQSYVGLSSSYGSLRLGRQYDFMVTNLQPLSSDFSFGGSLSSHAGDVDGIWGSYPISNAVKYLSPTFRGLNVGGLYSFGGVPGSTAKARAYGFGANYAMGGLKLGLAYLNVNNPATALYDASTGPVAGKPFTNPVTNPIYSGYASARNVQIFGLGGDYVLGATTFGAVYTYTHFTDAVATPGSPFQGSASLNTAEGYVSYRFTPFVMGGLVYEYTKTPSAHYNELALGSQYFFSKRTFVYLIAAWQRASGIDSTGHAAVADLTYLTASSTSNQAAVRVGIRHSF